jgi:rubrerythrin
MRRTFVALAVAIAGLALAAPLAAQTDEAYLELLRSDLRQQKADLITEAMQFSVDQANVFWPIYREYDAELTVLGDEYLDLLRTYADNYQNLSEDMAKELVERVFDHEARRAELLKKYFKRISRELDAVTAARFVQLERQIDLLIDVQIASQVPLIP